MQTIYSVQELLEKRVTFLKGFEHRLSTRVNLTLGTVRIKCSKYHYNWVEFLTFHFNQHVCEKEYASTSIYFMYIYK